MGSTGSSINFPNFIRICSRVSWKHLSISVRCGMEPGFQADKMESELEINRDGGRCTILRTQPWIFVLPALPGGSLAGRLLMAFRPYCQLNYNARLLAADQNV